ncbi:DUF6196 family protein [Mucilaginibacter sp. OK098]|uniref:DUF6196 family protein n=1 Tax=Mucilaginibacter sp. OK098 TaxID=1855297 RepID=UPI00091FF268|nr:DUF6196 family protein [Mucilaginibacter sp. OK098]SHL90976.1 hypothetical protein SAMN05216524_101148 [Mucilaginibacter sp. OK098]
MYISGETGEQTEHRLRHVIRNAQLKVYDGLYFFKEIPINSFEFDQNALAIVRDHQVWSYLVPVESDLSENFKVFSFHFQPGADNSGFVGWLASLIKARLGSGVFVICGQNSNSGGIFDYWGCPALLTQEIIGLISELRG